MSKEIIAMILGKTTGDTSTKIFAGDLAAPLEELSSINSLAALRSKIALVNVGEESTYKNVFAKKNYLKSSNWPRSSSSAKPHRFTSPAITTFLSNLLKSVAENTSPGTVPILARNNLFHRHMVFDSTKNDFFIVFYVFAYP